MQKTFFLYHTQFSLVHFCLKFLVTQLWAFHKIEVETLSSRIATIQMLSLSSGSNFTKNYFTWVRLNMESLKCNFFFQYDWSRYQNINVPCISFWTLVLAQIQLSSLKTGKIMFFTCSYLDSDPPNAWSYKFVFPLALQHQAPDDTNKKRGQTWLLDSWFLHRPDQTLPSFPQKKLLCCTLKMTKKKWNTFD